MMRLGRLGGALVVVSAVGAVLAGTAFAAATQELRNWRTGGVLTGSETIGASTVGTWKFATEVAGTKYVLEWTGIECVGCKIENIAGNAWGSGQLKFKGVTVKEPAGCSVASEILTTAFQTVADYMSFTTAYIWVVPSNVPTEFAKFPITGCSLATTLVAKGNVFLQAANTTGAYATEQEVRSSEAINSAAGGSLKVGPKNAALTGNAKLKLSSGAVFGVE
jgi:hypothetical protein